MVTVTEVQKETGLKNLLTKARNAGMPRDQIERFVSASYLPLPWSLQVHATAREADAPQGPLWIGLGGARGPGKTHLSLAQVGIDDCHRRPGLKVLFLRKKKAAAKESMEDKAHEIFAGIRADVKRDRIDFPNGSRIIMGGYWTVNQAIGYLGIEYDAIVIEEATQLTEDEHEESKQVITKVRGALRSTLPGWRPRVYLTTNPGGPGHMWFKNNFVMPWREGNNDHRFIGGRTRFFPSTWKDNPFLSQDYIDYLMAIKGPLGKAWREGDWDVFAGMAFPQWNYDTHTVEPFEIPDHWPRWRAVDWGEAAPFCCLWFAKDLDTDRVYVYREAYKAGLSTRTQAKLIKSMTLPDEDIRHTFADPSMWAKKSHEDQWYSSAQEYRDAGVPLVKADNDRLMGKRKVSNILGTLPDGKPGVQVFRTCDNFIRTIPNLPRDELHPEDVDTDAEDHAYDAFKYGLTNQQKIKPPPKQEEPARLSKALDNIL
jgi:hypothetical protein